MQAKRHPNLPIRTVSPGLPLHALKCCPLCGSLNAKRNGSCLVCGWRGEFDTDADTIMTALHEIVLQCPAIIDIIAREPEERVSILTRLLGVLRKRKHRPLDLSA